MKCEGIFGKIFGHKFVSRIVESIPPLRPLPDFYGTHHEHMNILDRLSHKKYKIICKRCGVEND